MFAADQSRYIWFGVVTSNTCVPQIAGCAFQFRVEKNPSWTENGDDDDDDCDGDLDVGLHRIEPSGT